jgi:RNA polymerase sigma-54 factor
LLAHLDLLARKDIHGLLRVCGCDAEDLADMIREVRLLNPKPGLAFGHEVVQPVVPDVFVRETSNGSWHVELNSDTLPKVLLNTRYHASVNREKSREAKAYLTDCLNSANWLLKSLDQRAKTILKVATEIVRQQDSFLALGVQHLRPLNLRTIADAISMHESTVSRVTANKYMATPRGVFEFKYFFTSAISAVDGGESHSAEAVRHRIRRMIEAEARDKVLSDDRIVELLKGAGIDIARRTVAKYREGMGIPSSVQRRRLNHVGA